MSDTEHIQRKTHLSDDALQHFKTKLQDLKKEEEAEIKELHKSVGNIDDDAGDTRSSRAHHPGDVASDDQIKKTSYTLIEKKKEKIDKIIVALDRIEAGTYGVCMTTGKPIQKERLEAIPYAMHAVEVKK